MTEQPWWRAWYAPPVPPEAEPVSDEARDRAIRCEHEATQALPDPYGPDPVVFGRYPRVRAD